MKMKNADGIRKYLTNARIKPTPTSAPERRTLTRFAWWPAALLCMASSLSVAATDWRLTHGQSQADYLSTSLTLTSEGFRPICLDVDGTGASSKYSVVWLKDGFADWLSEIELTADEFNSRIASLTQQGYRVLCLDSHGTYPQELYAAVWMKDAHAADTAVLLRNLNGSGYASYAENGYFPTWWDINPSGSDRWFATIYSKGSGDFALWYGMNEAVFRQKLQECSAWAWPSVVRSYNGLFAAVWVDYCRLDSEDVRVEINQTAVELGHAIRQYSLDGYQPISVAQSSTTGTALFNTVWKRLGSLEPNRIDGIERLPEGEVQLRIQNDVPDDLGRFFELVPVQASTNLLDWEFLLTEFKTNANPAPALRIDEQAVNLEKRFYRTPTNRFITPFLKPTGPFGVGEFSRLLTDPNRYDPSTGNNMQFMVTCWYPASSQAGPLPAPYIADWVARNCGYLLPGSRVAAFAAHGSEGRALATNSLTYPVVLRPATLNSHRRNGLMLSEELASHGFVVIGLDHGDTPAAVYPDGTEVRGQPDLSSDAAITAAQPEHTADARFVIDVLEQWASADPLLAAHLDLDNVAAFGHDFGGSTAADLANTDIRCKAAADIEGLLWGEPLVSTGPIKPFLMIRSETPDPAHPGDNRLAFFQRAQAAAHFLKISGTVTASFDDRGSLLDMDRLSALAGKRVTTEDPRVQELTRAALVSFFKRHLKGEEDGVLDQLATNSPDVKVSIQLNGGPVITMPVAPATNLVGESLTLRVAATGQDPLSYEWRANSCVLPGATDASLVINPVTMATAGYYSVRVSDANGSATCSAPVTILPVRFTTQPQDVKVPFGTLSTFRVVVQGPAPVTYQWQHDGQDILNATDATLTRPGSPECMGRYSVRVANVHGSAQSASARLCLGPSIIERPQHRILRVGENLEVSSRVVGSLPMTYLWRWEGTLQSRLTRESLTSSLWVPNVHLTNAGVYSLTVSNQVGYASGGVVSASIIVVDPPGDQEGVAGSTVTFAASVSNRSALPPGLQWQFSGVNIDGATTTSLTLTNIQPASAGTYTLVITNNVDQSVSFPAALRVIGK